MKQTKLFLLMLVFLLAFATSYAQDNEFSALFALNAQSGMLQDKGEDQFSLTLTDASTYSWFSQISAEGTDPMVSMDAGQGETQFLVAIWDAAPESLVAPTAVLSIDGISVEFSLAVPIYDEASDTLIFDATLITINLREDMDANKYVLPSTFENTTLFIRADVAFISHLAIGAGTLEGNTREGPDLDDLSYLPYGYTDFLPQCTESVGDCMAQENHSVGPVEDDSGLQCKPTVEGEEICESN